MHSELLGRYIFHLYLKVLVNDLGDHSWEYVTYLDIRKALRRCTKRVACVILVDICFYIFFSVLGHCHHCSLHHLILDFDIEMW